jgi:hypothetical protein
VGPSIPSGRAARDAWRALSHEARQAAFAAAKQGVAPPDIGLAWAAAGYGRTMARRYRIIVALLPLGVVVLMVAAITAIVVTRVVGVVVVVIPLMFVVYVAGILALSRRMRRYQRLYNSGLLGVEAAQLGASVSQPSPAVWATSSYQSEFTVPYEARVPMSAPEPRTPADPARAGVHEIPARIGPLVTQLSIFGILTVVLWVNAVLHLANSTTSTTSFAGSLGLIWLILAVFLTIVTGLLLLLVLPALRRRLIARFTPNGWELPSGQMAGPWTAVREIRIRQLNVRQSSNATAALAGYRMVALIVDHPDGYLVRLSPLRRALVRRTMKKYGSPVVIVASPRRSIPLVDLVRLLQHYTDAPVTWN